jgi:hypothetical protein
VEYALAIVILLALAWFVSAPLRGREQDGEEVAEGDVEDPVLAELEARKEAKYREIRDAELDRAQGKLNEADFHRQDAELRAEAIAILKELDRVQGKSPARAKEAR